MFWMILSIVTCLNMNAQETLSRFSADNYARKSQEDKIILDGNVNIVKGKTVLKANKVELNTKTQDFLATGNVSYESVPLKISGETIQGNMDSPKGFIQNGTIVNDKDIFEGKKIERLDKKHFLLKEGRYTSCINCPPDWRLYGNDIDLQSGEYVHMKDVVVEAFGLPVTYIPYLVLPVKDERQSGFLTPNMGFGADGFNIQESYFWAMTRSQDMTFTLGHYNSRGTKEGVEFRSAYAPESYTNTYFLHVNDQKFSDIIINNNKLNVKDRYGLKLDQDFKLSDATYAKMRILYTSDQNIPRDFPDEIPGRAEPALENKFLLTTHSNNVTAYANTSYYENLLSKNPLDRNGDQLQRLPEITASLAKTKFSAFMFEGDASYLNIYRTGSPFDDNNANHTFDTGDFIRTGQRFDIYPRLSMPLSNRFIKFTPEIGVRYDYYVLPEHLSADRAYAEMTANLSTEISAVYQRNSDKQYRSIKHVIEPFIQYNLIPTLKQSTSPFFDATSNGMTAPEFDTIDRIGRTNTITYGINNRLLAKYMKNFIASPIVAKTEIEKPQMVCENCKNNSGDIMTENTQTFLGLRDPESAKLNDKNTKHTIDEDEFAVLQPFQWKIYQSYDFLDKTGKPFGYIFSDMLSNYEWITFLLSTTYDIYAKKLGANSRLRFTGKAKYIELGYYNNTTATNTVIDQVKLLFGFSLWRFGTNISFILDNTLKGTFMHRLADKYLDLTYQPPANCWFLKLSVDAPYDKPGINTTITFNLIISGQAVGFGA